MFRFLTGIFLVVLSGCSAIPMLDFAGKGSRDRDICYEVSNNLIVSRYKAPIDHITIWKYQGDSLVRRDRLYPDSNAKQIVIPQLKDSLPYYNFEVSVHLEDDHWRMLRHLEINSGNIQKKEKIYSRFTSH